MPRARRWSLLASVNLAALLFAFGAGWRSSETAHERLDPPRTGGTSYDAGAALDDARTILAINGRALFWIVLLGVFSCGAYGLLLLGVHGHAIGSALAAASHASPPAFWHVLSYAPLEFATFAAANCAAQMITCSGCDWLRGRPTPDVRPAFAVVGCALPLLAVAAGLEAHAMQSVRELD